MNEKPIINVDIEYENYVDEIVQRLKTFAKMGVDNLYFNCAGVTFSINDYFEKTVNNQGYPKMQQIKSNREMIDDVFLKLTGYNEKQYFNKMTNNLRIKNELTKKTKDKAMTEKRLEWLVRGERHIYPQLEARWDWFVVDATSEAFENVHDGRAVEIERVLELMAALDKVEDLDFSEATKIFSVQKNEKNFGQSICMRLLEFHPKGPDFLEYEILKTNLFDDDSHPDFGLQGMIKDKRNRNQNFELENKEKTKTLKKKN